LQVKLQVTKGVGGNMFYTFIMKWKILMQNKVVIIFFAVILAITGSDAAAQSTQKIKKRTFRKTQNVRVELKENGYQPVNFRLRRNILARVTFIRKIEDECGKEIIIPAYNIRRTLPLNQPVTVSFTPRKAGTFGFACGMNMLRGKLIVQ
jgi:plastocyanin domain-containing protein